MLTRHPSTLFRQIPHPAEEKMAAVGYVRIRFRSRTTTLRMEYP